MSVTPDGLPNPPLSRGFIRISMLAVAPVRRPFSLAETQHKSTLPIFSRQCGFSSFTRHSAARPCPCRTILRVVSNLRSRGIAHSNVPFTRRTGVLRCRGQTTSMEGKLAAAGAIGIKSSIYLCFDA